MIRSEALHLKDCVSFLLNILQRGYSSVIAFLRIYFGSRKKSAKKKSENAGSSDEESKVHSLSVTSLDLIANEFFTAADDHQHQETLLFNPSSTPFVERLVVSDDDHDHKYSTSQQIPLAVATTMTPADGVVDAHSKNPLLQMNRVYDDQKSRWEAMRLKKHFTVQTSMLLKPNETSYVGAFAVSTELRTVKRSPVSFLPLAKHLFSRTEFMLVKSAILVFITCRYADNHSSQRLPIIVPQGQHTTGNSPTSAAAAAILD